MLKNRTTSDRQPEVLLTLRRGEGPLHRQIERGLRDAVRSGRLQRGAPLPSTRVLARDLGVSRGVVVEAYDQLVAEGFLASLRGSRTVVAAVPAAAVTEPPEPIPPAVRWDFRPARTDLRLFPHAIFARAARQVLRRLGPAHLAYGDPQGAPELRSALAEYVGRVRHVVARPRDILICNGFAQGLGVLAQALARRRVRRIALEDPGHPDLRQIVRQAGLVPVPVPVDGEGLRVDRLARLDVRAVLVSPAHQFPTGVVLAPERRQALCAWAARQGAVVIEDDYDGEYRYDRAGVGALQGLDPEHVVYAGSASKILAPALRVGWLILPRSLREGVTEAKRIADLGSATLDQLVYAELLRGGELDRHLRRMRRVYRRRRDVLVAALHRHLPDWRIRGAAAGLHIVVELPRGLREERVVQFALERSIRVYPMSAYRATASRGEAQAVVLGYGGLSEDRLRDAARSLAGLRGSHRPVP